MILMIVLWYLISFMRGIQLTNQVLFPKYAQYIYIYNFYLDRQNNYTKLFILLITPIKSIY
jgi:hypothetical protein